MSTLKQKKALDNMVENGGIISTAMIKAGYSENTAKTPQKLTESKGWRELVEERLPDTLLSQQHKELLLSTTLDHMVFPLGPKKNKEKEEYIEKKRQLAIKANREYIEEDILSDEDIAELLRSVNCTARRFVHGETARHVYFWSPDNKARKDGLDMAYKLKGSYAPEKSINVNLNGDIIPNEELLAIANQLNGSPKITEEADNTGASVASDGASADTVDAEISNQDQ